MLPLADLTDRALGCVLGGAVGDALGAPFEGLWSRSIPEAPALLAGFAEYEGFPRGQYTDDLASADMLHAVILRSSVAHGRIKSIDTAAARKMPGIHAVITAADIGTVPTIPLRHDPLPTTKRYVQPIIAVDKVRFVGEPLAVVVADSVALAEDALDAIAVDIEPLPAVVEREAARQRSGRRAGVGQRLMCGVRGALLCGQLLSQAVGAASGHRRAFGGPRGGH